MIDQNLVNTTKSYYDSTDADEFYYTIWGGEDIHIGIYNFPGEPIAVASRRTVERMVAMLPPFTKDTKVLDLGSGYGGAARYLATTFGCTVECLNLSDTENKRNEEKNKAAGLDKLITVHQGNFEEIPVADNSYDIVWSEDAFLHSDNKSRIFQEVQRVLVPGGQFIFSDPMQADRCPPDVLTPILKRIHLKEMGSVNIYRHLAMVNSLSVEHIDEMPQQLTSHYQAVYDELLKKESGLLKVCSREYIENMKKGLLHWIEGGKNGYLNWGLLHFKK